MKTAKTHKSKAQKLKTRLIKAGALSKTHQVYREGDYLFFPLTKELSKLTIVEKNCQPKTKKVTVKQLLKDTLTKKELELLPKAFDIIGSILIFELKKELRKHQKKIAKAYLQTNRNVETVARKKGSHKGKYRKQKVKILAGKKTKETVHHENGIKLKLNVEKVYFSPRSATERLRIAKRIKPKDRVLVMFSGCAPFAITIAKMQPTAYVEAIEINPKGHKYAKINNELNKTNVKLYKGDVRKVLKKRADQFDHIIMPLPKTAETFLDLARKHCKGRIYLYLFDNPKNEKKIKKKIENGHSWAKTKKIVKCGQYKPDIARLCVEIEPKSI